MNRLPAERDMDQLVHSWMREADEQPADRNRQVGRIMGRIDETRQRRGAWRFLPVGRRARRVDADDDELYEQAGGTVAVRRGASSAMALAAVFTLVLIGAAFVALRPGSTAPGAGGVPASPAPTVYPDDAELMGAFAGVFSGQRTNMDDVLRVYADDAVHTVMWHDRVDRFEGPVEIWRQIQDSENVDPATWILLPDPPGVLSNERRYLSVTGNLGGIVCVGTVADDRIQRHDCILPMASSDRLPGWASTADDTLAVRAALWDAFLEGWGSDDAELVAATVSEEIVHHVAYNERETMHTGIEEYLDVMGSGPPTELADPIPLPAPAGEHRWTDYSDIAGGTLCTFWERDGLIVRHDCLVPVD